MNLTLMLHLNVLIGAAGTTVYLLWAGKWWYRGLYGLFFVNLLSALVVAAFAYGSAVILLNREVLVLYHNVFHYLLPFLIGGPVIARILEYRQDQLREEFHRSLTRKFMERTDGAA